MKRTLIIILALILIPAASLTGCLDTDRLSGAVTVTIMGRKSDLAKSYMTRIFRMYEEKTGNRIKPVSFEDAEFEEKAAERFASGDVPDIFMHFHNSDLARFDVEGNFRYLNDQQWVDELTEGTLAYCLDADGNLLGLPYWENSVSGCYYNKTVLDSLGLRPATNQAEFDALCRAIAAAGYTPLCWPADGSAWMVQFALDPVFADNTELLRKINKNEITYADIPQVADMVRWIGDAADSGWFGQDYLRVGIDDISRIMGSGGAVMTFIWDTWFYTDLAADGRYTVDDFALMPAFLNTVDGGTYEGGNLNMRMVNKNGKHVDACLDFLSFCATEENYNAAFDGISTVKCFKGQTTNIQSPMVTDAAASVEANLRASTAVSKIVGYSDENVASALESLFRKKTDTAGCVALLDKYRSEAARNQGAEGF